MASINSQADYYRMLGIQINLDPVYDIRMACGQDKVYWSEDSKSGEWKPQVPYQKPALYIYGQPDPVGYALFDVSKGYMRFMKREPLSIIAPLSMQPPSTTASASAVDFKVIGGDLYAAKPEDLDALTERDWVRFRSPAAIMTNLNIYGVPVWMELRDRNFYIETHGTKHVVTTDVLGGMYGKHWQTRSPAYGNTAQGAGASAGAAAAYDKAVYQSFARSVGKSTSLGLTWMGVDFAETKAPLSRVITTGEIVAWRGWRYTEKEQPWYGTKELRLTSIYMTTKEWSPVEPFASKAPNDHDDYDGIHAFKTEEEARKYLIVYGNKAIVLGRVHLWGEVVEGEIGYRAEQARIISLDDVLNADMITMMVNNGTEAALALDVMDTNKAIIKRYIPATDNIEYKGYRKNRVIDQTALLIELRKVYGIS